jgi:Spy/CpxP family protein refolding chaperone
MSTTGVQTSLLNELEGVMHKRQVIALGFGAAFFGLVTVASAQAQRPGRAGGFGRGAHAQAGPGRQGGADKALLKGITLTDAQKAQLKEIRKQEHGKAQGQAQNAQVRTAMQQAREARQRGDTATARAKMLEVRTAMQQARAQNFAQIRAILTPDQQRQFDANVAAMKQRVGRQASRKASGH